jgi:hypothetical protein
MDIFQTSVTSCGIVYNYLEAYSNYSAQSGSLAARFKWDLHVLQNFVHFFSSRKVHGKISDEDNRLLDESVTYLGSLMERLASATAKISATNRWSKEMNKALWVFRKKDFENLQRELFEWTQRLDLRLVALPERLRDGIIPVEEPEETERGKAFTPAPVIQRRIERFLKLSSDGRRREWESLWIDNPDSCIVLRDHGPAKFTVADFASKMVILEHKPYPLHYLGDTTAFEFMRQEVGEFAAALKSLNSSIAGLLRCIGLFHESDSPPRFTLVHEIPFIINANPPSLKSLISRTNLSKARLLPVHPLNERFALARKLAAAVLFLHSIGWVHKAIRSQNILVIERAQPSEGAAEKQFPHSLGDPYLVNFQSSRTNDGETDPNSRGVKGWEEEIYHHPKRQILKGRSSNIRYSMLHDVYSLGVVLLELGIWRPLEKYADRLRDSSPEERRACLVELAGESEIQMGRRYKELVCCCLKLDDDDTHANTRYAMNILETLEDMVSALS